MTSSRRFTWDRGTGDPEWLAHLQRAAAAAATAVTDVGDAPPSQPTPLVLWAVTPPPAGSSASSATPALPQAFVDDAWRAGGRSDAAAGGGATTPPAAPLSLALATTLRHRRGGERPPRPPPLGAPFDEAGLIPVLAPLPRGESALAGPPLQQPAACRSTSRRVSTVALCLAPPPRRPHDGAPCSSSVRGDARAVGDLSHVPCGGGSARLAGAAAPWLQPSPLDAPTRPRLSVYPLELTGWSASAAAAGQCGGGSGGCSGPRHAPAGDARASRRNARDVGASAALPTGEWRAPSLSAALAATTTAAAAGHARAHPTRPPPELPGRLRLPAVGRRVGASARLSDVHATGAIAFGRRGCPLPPPWRRVAGVARPAAGTTTTTVPLTAQWRLAAAVSAAAAAPVGSLAPPGLARTAVAPLGCGPPVVAAAAAPGHCDDAAQGERLLAAAGLPPRLAARVRRALLLPAAALPPGLRAGQAALLARYSVR